NRAQPDELPTSFSTKTRQLYSMHNIDAFQWLASTPMNSIEAVVTDPPYGLVEYSDKELTKLKNGKGGIWRLPPAFDGNKRMPLPRFTVLTETDQKTLRDFSFRLASLLKCVLVPGGHVFIATNPLISHLVYESFLKNGLEKRGEIIRTVYIDTSHAPPFRSVRALFRIRSWVPAQPSPPLPPADSRALVLN